MNPYDHWKTTDFDGERRAAAGEWIDTRANELMDDYDFLRGAASDILETTDDAVVNAIVELIASVIALHGVRPDRLLGSGVLLPLYAHAKEFHQCAMDAAIEQAERELDTLEQAAPAID